MLSMRARRAASRSHTASPTTYASLGGSSRRRAHSTNRSGSGLARRTSPRSTTTVSSGTPSAASEPSISGCRPEVAIPWVIPRSRSSASRSTAPGSGRRSSAGSSSRNSSPWRRWTSAASWSVRSRPSSRATARWSGDDAVPRGLAVASAVALRAGIVVAAVVVVALAVARLMVVVLPVIIAILLTNLLMPAMQALLRRGWRPAPAAAASTLLAVLGFAGLWALIIPGVVSQSDELVSSLQQGAGHAVSVLEPLGVSRADVETAIDDGLRSIQANEVITGAVLLTTWAAAVVLIVMLTFFFLKDGERLWDWVIELFHEDRQPAVRMLRAGARSPSAKREGSGAPAARAAARRSAIAGPCLNPCPEPPPTNHTPSCSGWRAAMKCESGDRSYRHVRAATIGASSSAGNRSRP